MSPISRLWNRYLRWRHSKGFGVHSPFAYRMVTDVISPGNYGYYGYHEIDREFLLSESRNNRCMRKDMHLLLRLAVNLNAQRILTPKNPPRELKTVAKALNLPFTIFDPTKDFHTHKNDLLVSFGDPLSESCLTEALEEGCTVAVFNPDEKTRQILRIPLERGLLLEGTRILILIPRKEMAYVCYNIKF